MKMITRKIFGAAFTALLLTTLAVSAVQAKTDGSERNSNDCRSNGYSKGDSDSRSNSGLRVFGLTSDQRLICFAEDRPDRAKTVASITGLTGGDTMLVGFDFRVQDGFLYGVGNGGGVYRINTETGAATFVNQLTVALSGASFGVDFNPAADRLRIISDTGQNLRHNINAGGVTINDGALSYTAPATTTALGVTGAAYTNNDLDATTATTLFSLDTNLDQIAIQSPANNGTLAATGKLTVDTTSNVGFDIYSTVREGITVNVEGFATLTSATDGRVTFYSVALLNGKATSRGRFAATNQVIDIAIPLAQR